MCPENWKFGKTESAFFDRISLWIYEHMDVYDEF